MIKIAHVKETNNLQLPQEVIDVIRSIAVTLDHNYSASRNIDEDMGGYILVITAEEELYELRNDNIDVCKSYPEFVDRIVVNDGNDWTNTLILCNNEFGISLIMPLSITPKNFIDEME